jgi:HEPN domain-containing protein
MDLVKEWFDFASNDLLAARHLFEDVYPKQLAISCFHCQQSTEKDLKDFYTAVTHERNQEVAWGDWVDSMNKLYYN